MDALTYEDVYKGAEATILKLTEEARGQLDESNMSYWDMAQGVLRMWIILTGQHAKVEDVEKLQLLIDDMPGVDDEGEGNWRLSPVVTL